MNGNYLGEGLISPLSLLGSGTDVGGGFKYFEASTWFSLDDDGDITWKGGAYGLGINVSFGSKLTSSFSTTTMTFPTLNDDTKQKIENYEANSKN